MDSDFASSLRISLRARVTELSAFDSRIPPLQAAEVTVPVAVQVVRAPAVAVEFVIVSSPNVPVVLGRPALAALRLLPVLPSHYPDAEFDPLVAPFGYNDSADVAPLPLETPAVPLEAERDVLLSANAVLLSANADI